jgi:hypothetical protein
MNKAELEQLVAALRARLDKCNFTYEVEIGDEEGTAIKMVVSNFQGSASTTVTDSKGKVYETNVLEDGDTLVLTVSAPAPLRNPLVR